MIAITDKFGWIRCGNCGHKLMKQIEATGEVVLETKCHSCKEHNTIRIVPVKQAESLAGIFQN